MFWPDVIDLKSFYATGTGQIACRELRRQIAHIWPAAPNETIVGLGFATPFLLSYIEKSDMVIACMPAGQGVVHWPQTRANLALLGDETQLPLQTGTVNRMLMVHALENSEHVRLMLQEARRVLTPSGRLLVVVPNRSGSWARSAKSPFAYGQPFTGWQLRKLLNDHKFTPLQTRYALFFPPHSGPFFLRISRWLDALGRRLFSGLGGVIIVEAEKQVYAATGSTQRVIERLATAPAPVPAQ